MLDSLGEEIQSLLSKIDIEHEKMYFQHLNHENGIVSFIKKNETTNVAFRRFKNINPHLSIRTFFTFYKGHVNQNNLPSGYGLQLTIVDIMDENFDEELSFKLIEIERTEGEWKDANLIQGTYKTYTSVFSEFINPIEHKNFYKHYMSKVLHADENPGKRALSTEIEYKGCFDSKMRLIGNEGELLIEYKIDWIRNCYEENGIMLFKGKFVNNYILSGIYTGPYFGFDGNNDKLVKYTGSFKNNIFHGYGELEYNLNGGFFYKDRVKSCYIGNFRNGLRHDKNAVEKCVDECGVLIDFEGCEYENNVLLSISKLKISSDECNVFGFEESYFKYNNLEFCGDILINEYFKDNPEEFDPIEALQYCMERGCLTIRDDLTSLIYKNNHEGVTGKYIFNFGKLILDGDFFVLNELDHSLTVQKWRYGYLIDSYNKETEQTNIVNTIKTIISEIIDAGKESFKRAATATSNMETFQILLLFSAINLIASFSKSFSNYVLKSKCAKDIPQLLQSCINSIKGEIKEHEFSAKIQQEETEAEVAFCNFRGGKRSKIFFESKAINDLLHGLGQAEELFTKTSEVFNKIFEVLKQHEPLLIKKSLFSVDDITRDYLELKEVYNLLDTYKFTAQNTEISQDEIKQANLALKNFSTKYMELLRRLNKRISEFS